MDSNFEPVGLADLDWDSRFDLRDGKVLVRVSATPDELEKLKKVAFVFPSLHAPAQEVADEIKDYFSQKGIQLQGSVLNLLRALRDKTIARPDAFKLLDISSSQ